MTARSALGYFLGLKARFWIAIYWVASFWDETTRKDP